MSYESKGTSKKIAKKFKDNHSRILSAIITALLVLAVFTLGLYVGAKNGLNIQLGFPVASKNLSLQDNEDTTELAKRIAEVNAIVSQDALSPFTLDEATWGAINGLLYANQDYYARYYTPEQYEAHKELSSGQFGGIGVVLSDYKEQAYIVRVYENTPAAEAGIKPGDFIVAINGDRETQWTFEAVANAVKGDPGKEVEITWRRPTQKDDPGGEEFTAVLTTDEITYPNVVYELVDNIGFISIAQFNERTANEVSGAIDVLDDRGAEAYILDLRGNPGGLVTQAIDVTSLFLDSGTVVEINSRNEESNRENATGAYKTGKPLVIVVNEDTASAAEIVASALQDHKRALIVGAQTFGKGSVQTVKDLSFGGGIKYTIATYCTPDGYQIEGVGIKPDLIVESAEQLIGVKADSNFNVEDDAQLKAAFESAKKIMALEGSLDIDGLSNPPGSEPQETPDLFMMDEIDEEELEKDLQEDTEPEA